MDGSEKDFGDPVARMRKQIEDLITEVLEVYGSDSASGQFRQQLEEKAIQRAEAHRLLYRMGDFDELRLVRDLLQRVVDGEIFITIPG